MVYTLLQQKDSVAKGLITLKVKGQLYSYFSALQVPTGNVKSTEQDVVL